MAKFTTQVKTICEVNAGLLEGTGFDDVDKTIKDAIPKVFNFDFPIFDSTYKDHLCYEILLRNYTKEIAHETVGLWKLKLKTRLHEIMPYYNQLYESALLKFNPMYDMDLERTYKKTGDGTTYTLGNVSNNEISSSDTTGRFTSNKDGGRTSDVVYSEDVNGNNEFNHTSKDDEKGTSTNTTDSTAITENSTDAKDVKTLENIARMSDTPQGMVADIKLNKYLTKVDIDNNDETIDRTVLDNGKNDTTVLDTGESKLTKDSTAKNTEKLITNRDGDSLTTDSYNEENIGTNSSNVIGNKNATILSDTNVNSTSLEDYVELVKGKNGGVSYSKMLNEFRTTFLNIDEMVNKDLQELFFHLWEVGYLGW